MKYSRYTHEENACNYILATCIFSKYFHAIHMLVSIYPDFQQHYNKIL